MHALLAGANLLAMAALSLPPWNQPSSQPSWKRNPPLHAVLQWLKQDGSQVARHTVEAIQSGAVHLETLDHMSVQDCIQLFTDNPAEWAHVDPRECGDPSLPFATVPDAVLRTVTGFQVQWRIYISVHQSLADAAETLVHEVNHIANHSNTHASSPARILADEYRAYWVATTWFDHHPPNAAACRKLKEFIIQSYVLSGVTPADVEDVPTGNLDNRVAFTEGSTAGCSVASLSGSNHSRVPAPHGGQTVWRNHPEHLGVTRTRKHRT